MLPLFYRQGALAKGSAYFGRGTGQIWLDDMNCMGNETDLAYCGHRGWGNTNCNHGEDVSVICMGKFTIIVNKLSFIIL
jgi:hypothetical protein